VCVCVCVGGGVCACVCVCVLLCVYHSCVERHIDEGDMPHSCV